MNANDVAYVFGNYAKELLINPTLMLMEHKRFFSHWLLKKNDVPKEGILFETHCHTNFSSVHPSSPELADVVEMLIEKQMGIVSITDHGNTDAFDSLWSGSYDLNKESKTGKKYEIEKNSDGRYLIVHSDGKKLAMLRSIEYKTDKGELGLHGIKGVVPVEGGGQFEDIIHRTLDAGGLSCINHPYFMTGLGFHGRDFIERAVNAGAIAIEKNGTEIPPQIYSPVRAEIDAKDFGAKLVYGGDAHRLHMYLMSGLNFKQDIFDIALQHNNGNYADAVKELISTDVFRGYFNYITPNQWKEFFLKP